MPDFYKFLQNVIFDQNGSDPGVAALTYNDPKRTGCMETGPAGQTQFEVVYDSTKKGMHYHMWNDLS